MWQELVPDVRARLVSSDQREEDGRTLIGLEIDMPARYKTYWHVPGETGIPATFNFARSRGIQATEVHWPYPTIDTSTGYVDFAYFGHTVLPMELVAEAESAQVEATVLMGICSDICMPVEAHFSLPLDFDDTDTGNRLRLRQALAQTPIAWEKPQSPFGTVWFDPTHEALRVELLDPAIDPRSVIAAAPGGKPLFGAPESNGEAISFQLLGEANAEELAGLELTLTFLAPDGAYAITRSVELAPP